MIDGRCKKGCHMNKAARRCSVRSVNRIFVIAENEDVPAVGQAVFEDLKIKDNLQLKPGYMRKSRKISIRP